MKCPLLTDKKVVISGEPVHCTYDCLEEECAWWYEENQGCAILTLAQGSIYLHKALLHLDSKMPLGGKV